MSPEQKMPISDLVRSIKETYGMTWADMGAAVGRSDRMMRKLASGQSSGESFRASLEELNRTGQVERLPPRRRDSSGKIVPVRARRGAERPTRIPTETAGARRPSPQRVRHTHRTQHLPGGAKIHRTTMPPSEKAPTRAKGWSDVQKDVTRITRSQARADKRVKFSVTVRDSEGRTYERQIGSRSGYHASDVASDMRKSGGAESWMKAQMGAVYETDSGPVTIVGVQANEFSATRSKDERKAQDAAGTRRSRWRR